MELTAERRSSHQAGVAAVALFAVAGLRNALGFVGGQSLQASSSNAGSLRGSAYADLGAAAAAASVGSSTASGSLATGATAAVAVAAAAALGSRRSRNTSPVALHPFMVENDSEEFKGKYTRAQWYRRVKRASNDRAVFDVTIQKPLGIMLQPIPDAKKGGFKGVGVSKINPGGNVDEINKRVCIEESDPGMWILEGDMIVAVNGTVCEKVIDVPTIAGMIGESESEVTLTLVRYTRKGPIKVIMMPGGEFATVRRGSRLSAAAEFAFGKELKYGCIDGWCGTCWHRERTTNGIFMPCSDVLTGDWDNVMPLVLRPKPERAGDASIMRGGRGAT
eukprot:TRINITY_DN5463_c4_g1_i1.p1 TRINITY_DN5463_c4_g1~~TRINITY_DN5463_c4_g1_i1.p1  ORF type:complete len:334 (+),score=67.45 TRINITY_DN5463_c4_g1_i1:56-1057(+)